MSSNNKGISDFEKSIKRLEEIVTKLEREDSPLDETVNLFKEGMLLTKECKKTLAEVELSVNQVVASDEDGNVTVSKIKAKDE